MPAVFFSLPTVTIHSMTGKPLPKTILGYEVIDRLGDGVEASSTSSASPNRAALCPQARPAGR